MPYPRITADPARMGGVPCIRDTRIPVATIVAMIADGMGTGEILAAYPDLTGEDVAEALRFAAAAVRERAIPSSSAPERSPGWRAAARGGAETPAIPRAGSRLRSASDHAWVPRQRAEKFAIRYVLDVRPAPAALSDLRESVGYGRSEGDYPRAFDSYTTTVSAYDETDALVGWCATVGDRVRHAFVVDLIVHPTCERRGIGRELLRRAAEAEFRRGVSIFHADFATSMAGFYERCGFQRSQAGILRGVES